jgi:hypothetical protein
MTVPIYLVAAYAVFWIFTFILVLSIWIRQRWTEWEIDRLEMRIGEEGEST